MKVIRNTPQLLLLRHRPVVVPTFCWVLFASEIVVIVTQYSALSGYQRVLVVGLALGCAFAGVVTAVGTTVRFDARERVVEWIRSGPFAYRREHARASFDAIRGVAIEALAPGGDTGPTWRVFMVTRSRPLPLTAHYSNVGNHERLAATVRDWLRSAGVALPDDARGSAGN